MVHPKVEWECLRPPSEAQRMDGGESQVGSVVADVDGGDRRWETSPRQAVGLAPLSHNVGEGNCKSIHDRDMDMSQM